MSSPLPSPLARSGSARSTTLLVAPLLVAVALLTGCSGDEDDAAPGPGESDESGAVSEVAASAGELCPSVLPEPTDPGDGFGPTDPAPSALSLPAPESAAVCLYEPAESTTAEGQTLYTWTLSGAPVPAGERDLAALAAQIEELAPADADRQCRGNVGPRWLLASTVGDDLTGVVVDEFGCGDVRVSDNPFATAPGEAAQEGTQPGVFDGPEALLNRLKLVWVDG